MLKFGPGTKYSQWTAVQEAATIEGYGSQESDEIMSGDGLSDKFRNQMGIKKRGIVETPLSFRKKQSLVCASNWNNYSEDHFWQWVLIEEILLNIMLQYICYTVDIILATFGYVSHIMN